MTIRIDDLRGWLTLGLGLSVGLGCGGGSAASPGWYGPPDSGPGGGGPGGSSGAGATGVAVTGLPCDVATILQAKCVVCHSSPPTGGAPMSMVTYSDLTAPSKTTPGQSIAQLSVTRMQSTTLPMPPLGNPAPTPQEVAAFQAWVTAGAPAGSCAGLDAGSVTSPYATPVQCSSGTSWTGGTDGRPDMKPGGPCVSCHASPTGERPPQYTIAGTVYKTAHEPDDCNGTNVSGATVDITDANNHTFSIPVNMDNGVGNFHTTQAVATPFHAKVVYGGKQRAMSAAQTSGDCNACHTESGVMSAPGRIMLP
jgi:hypothetical protein